MCAILSMQAKWAAENLVAYPIPLRGYHGSPTHVASSNTRSDPSELNSSHGSQSSVGSYSHQVCIICRARNNSWPSDIFPTNLMK